MNRPNLKQWIPNADIREYYQYWFPDIPENCQNGIVGAIKNFTNENLIIRIIIDDQWMNMNHQRGCCVTIDNNHYLTDSTITLEREFFEACRADDIVRSFLWHEVGHFHTMRYFGEYVSESSRIRKEFINRGQVHPAELTADLVAAYYTSQQMVSDAIRKRAIERQRLVDRGDENAQLAWWELRSRRKEVLKYQNTEEIEKRICELCNVTSIETL